MMRGKAEITVHRLGWLPLRGPSMCPQDRRRYRRSLVLSEIGLLKRPPIKPAHETTMFVRRRVVDPRAWPGGG